MPDRYLKHGICDSELIDKCTPLAEVLFYRLIVNVDDAGMLDARPAVVRAKCFPLKEVMTYRDVEGLLLELASKKLITLYSSNGCDCLQMNKWDSETKTKTRIAKVKADYSDEFSQVWALYPRKAGANKKLAYKQWCSRIVTGVNPQTITDGVLRYIKYCDACQTEDRFIKQPETFFGPNDHYLSNWDVPASRASPTQAKQTRHSAFMDKLKSVGEQDERDITGIAVRLD